MKRARKVILKLGGSVITKKDVDYFPLTIDEIKKRANDYIRVNDIKRIGREIYRAHAKLILINGVGPFGHHLVDKKQPLEVVHESVAHLNKILVKLLGDCGLEIDSYAPLHTCQYVDGKFDISKLWKRGKKTLNKGKILSTYGDMLKGYVVISGDDLAVSLAKLWNPEIVIMAIDKDGVFDKNPELHVDARLIRKIRSEKDLERFEFKGTTVDVTGRLKAKVKKLLSAKVKSQIINGLTEGNVEKALLGDESIGTLIL